MWTGRSLGATMSVIWQIYIYHFHRSIFLTKPPICQTSLDTSGSRCCQIIDDPEVKISVERIWPQVYSFISWESCTVIIALLTQKTVWVSNESRINNLRSDSWASQKRFGNKTSGWANVLLTVDNKLYTI